MSLSLPEAEWQVMVTSDSRPLWGAFLSPSSDTTEEVGFLQTQPSWGSDLGGEGRPGRDREPPAHPPTPHPWGSPCPWP